MEFLKNIRNSFFWEGGHVVANSIKENLARIQMPIYIPKKTN